MELLRRKIREKGIVVDEEVLKVDSFLNHCIDPKLMQAIGKEFADRFRHDGVTKILTIESSGIAPAVFTGLELDVPVVFAKKDLSRNMSCDIYDACVHSFTKGRDYMVCVSKEYLNDTDKVLIIDDFLANGRAAAGLGELVIMSGASVAGIGVVIEKGFQKGGSLLREMGFRVEALAIIDSMSENGIIFRNEEEKRK